MKLTEERKVTVMSSLKDKHFIENDVRDINLKDFFHVIKRRLWIAVVITILSTTAGYFYSNHNYTPIYETSTRIIIESDNNYMSTLMVMIKDPIIMEKVQEELELSRSPESIAGQISVTRVDESQVIMISVTDQDPKIAMEIANATARSFKSEVGNLLDFDEVQLLSEAKENNFPINENKNRTVIIAFVFGLITGVGLIFLLDSLDERVDKESQVEEVLGVPVIGVISKINTKRVSTNRISQKEMELRSEKVGANK